MLRLPSWAPLQAIADCASGAADDEIVVVAEGKSGGGHVKAMPFTELAEDIRQGVEKNGFEPKPLPTRWLLVLHERAKAQLVRIELPRGAK